MDSDLSRQMFESGGTFVLLGMPPGTEFGIDMQSWNVGDKFKGVKMIPPGLHFIYFSAVSKTGDVAPRSGFFHYFKEKELVVKLYSEVEEDISPETNEEQVERIRCNLRSLDPNLGGYPLETYPKWMSLVQHITAEDVTRMSPLSGKICSVTELVHPQKDSTEVAAEEASSDEPPRELTSEEELAAGLKKINDMVPRPGTEIRFTKFPSKSYRIGATPQEITRYSIDSSYTLKTMFPHLESGPEMLLAELQFAFVTFLVGQVYEAFEHWKMLVGAICKAEETLLFLPKLFSQFMSTLHFRINEVPEDLFVDITEGKNFLADALTNLLSNVHDNASSLPPDFVLKSSKFKKHIKSKFQWSLSVEEEGEDAPVVVV